MASEPIFTDFSLGEVSPLLRGRFDLAEYPKGLEICENFYVVPQGGLQIREGTRWVANTVRTRLAEFIVSRTEAYVLEFSNLLLRVFRFNPTTKEAELITLVAPIVTPYLDSEIDSLDCAAQVKNQMYIFHGSHPPMVLTKVAYNNWTLVSSSTSGGILNPTPVEDPLAAGNDLYQHALKTPFWNIGNNKNFYDMFKGSANSYDHTTKGYLDVRVTTSASFAVGSTTEQTFTIREPVSTGVFSFEVSAADVGTVFQASSASGNVMPPYGKYSYWIITSFVDIHTFKAKMLTGLAAGYGATIDVRIAQWCAWSARSGYPSAGCIHEQRLVVGGTSLTPQVVWGSVAGDYTNMNTGTGIASDAYIFGLSGRDTSPIRWMVSCRVLLIGTEGAEYRVIPPPDIDIKQQTQWGSNKVQARKVGQSVFFCDRSGRKVLRLDYINTFDNYLAADLVHIAEHVSLSGIKMIAWQAYPRYMLWGVREDGQLVALSYVPELKMMAWQRIKTDGVIESIAVIPDADGISDRLWISVKRIIEVSGLVAQYNFNGMLGDTILREEISNLPPVNRRITPDLSGTLFGVHDEQTPWATSGFLTFNGVSEKAEIPALPAGDFSLAFYITPNVASIAGTVFSFGTNRVSCSAGSLLFTVNSTSVTSLAGLTSGVTYKVVATYSSASGIKLYIDNVLQGSASVSRGVDTATKCTLGESLVASLGHLRIFNKELTPAAVSILYNDVKRFVEVFDTRYQADCVGGTLPGKTLWTKGGDTYRGAVTADDSGAYPPIYPVPVIPVPFAMYHLEETPSIGATCIDSSGNGHDGTYKDDKFGTPASGISGVSGNAVRFFSSASVDYSNATTPGLNEPDLIEIPHHSSFNSIPLTIEFYMRLTLNSVGGRYILRKGGGTGFDRMYIQMSNNNPSSYYLYLTYCNLSQSSTCILYPASLLYGTWYKVRWVLSSTDYCKVYLDDVFKMQSASLSSGGMSNSSPIIIAGTLHGDDLDEISFTAG